VNEKIALNMPPADWRDVLEHRVVCAFQIWWGMEGTLLLPSSVGSSEESEGKGTRGMDSVIAEELLLGTAEAMGVYGPALMDQVRDSWARVGRVVVRINLMMMCVTHPVRAP